MPETQSFHITDIINDVKRGYIKIPQFQRDFIWSKEKAASLMDSILKGYPIGTMILWKTKETLRSIRNLGGVDLPETPTGDFIQYVLDGQQRLTSIFATLSGAKIRREFRIEDFSEIYINLDAADDEELVISSKDGFDEKSLIKLTALLYGGLQYLASFSAEYLQRLEQYKRNIETYPIPSILIREVPIDVATEIFTRINEGGKPLSVFEIMVAKTFDVEKGFDLAESCDALISNLSRVDYETLSEATVLRVVSILLKKECSKKAILNLNKTDFIGVWPKAVDAIERAVDYFRNYFKIPVSRLLPYDDLIVLFAYFFHHHKERPLGNKEKYLQDLFWRISLTERYSSGTESKIVQDIKKVDMILEDKLPDYNYSPFSKLTPEGIEQNGVFSVSRSYIKAILCILSEQQPKSFADDSIVRISNDWLKQANSRNYHHFFPKSYLAEQKVDYTKSNHIANITIVDDFLNKRVIGSKSPSEYMPLFSGNTVLDKTMKSHLIDLHTFGVLNDDYNLFFSQRIKAISNALKSKIIFQTIDQIDELLSASDPEAINAAIAKLNISKQNATEATDKYEDEVEMVAQDTKEPEENAKFSETAVEHIEENDLIDWITVARNKSSLKYFIYLEGDRDCNDTVVNPFGRIIPFDADLYSDPENIEREVLLASDLINEVQLSEYKKHLKLERYRDNLQQQERLARATYSGGSFRFAFRINNSFINNGVLTIPRQFNEFMMGTTEQYSSCPIKLYSLNEKRLRAHLYHGQSGWGRYFQLKIDDGPSFIHDGGLDSKGIGDTIEVEFKGDIKSPTFVFR